MDPLILDEMVGEPGLPLRDSIVHLQAAQVGWSSKFTVHALDAK